jgi:hypothetical protein
VTQRPSSKLLGQFIFVQAMCLRPTTNGTPMNVYLNFFSSDSISDESLASDEYSPDNILQAKIEALAEILDCTEEEAERAFFARL